MVLLAESKPTYRYAAHEDNNRYKTLIIIVLRIHEQNQLYLP